MLRGIQKKMIVVKTSADSCFESACFVLRPRLKRGSVTEEAMLYEAKRIIAQIEREGEKKKRPWSIHPLRFGLILFFIGTVCGALAVIGIWLLW